MTEEENILLQAVLDSPEADAPRLAYAEWCAGQTDEATRARARFIRTQLALVNGFDAMSYDEWFEATHLENSLRQRHRADWAGELAAMVDDYTFYRGFVSLVALPAREFLERAPRLFALAPIRHLKLTAVRSFAGELFASPFLNRIVSLDMNRCGLDDAQLAALAAAPALERLKWLSLAENEIGFDGADALAGSTLSPQLVYVNFYGNPVDPGGLYSADNELILDSWLPEAGERLEAKHGYLRWLHRDAETIHEVVPNRFRLA